MRKGYAINGHPIIGRQTGNGNSTISDENKACGTLAAGFVANRTSIDNLKYIGTLQGNHVCAVFFNRILWMISCTKAIAEKECTRLRRILGRLQGARAGAWHRYVNVGATRKTGEKTSKMVCPLTVIA